MSAPSTIACCSQAPACNCQPPTPAPTTAERETDAATLLSRSLQCKSAQLSVPHCVHIDQPFNDSCPYAIPRLQDGLGAKATKEANNKTRRDKGDAGDKGET